MIGELPTSFVGWVEEDITRKADDCGHSRYGSPSRLVGCQVVQVLEIGRLKVKFVQVLEIGQLKVKVVQVFEISRLKGKLRFRVILKVLI